MSRGPNVIDELRRLQRDQGYVTEDGLRALAERLDRPLHELHGVASFYPEFHLCPPPRVTIKVCEALPCQMRGGERLFRAIEREAAGHDDVVVKRCPCLGACDEAPAATINDYLQVCPGELDARRLFEDAVAAIRDTVEPPARFPVGIAGRFKIDPYEGMAGHFGALKGLIQSGEYDRARQKIKAADLRGMGGAGKAASRKWDQVAGEQSDEKYVVCNADESEPGTLKDREILRNVPHLLVEAMIIGGLVVGATKGYIYLRHEYQAQFNALHRAIEWARTDRFRGHPLLGKNVGGSGKAFDLEIFVSPGGYIMGEATALLEALEGKRGQPRNQIVDLGMRRGIPSFNGLWGKPTLLNNVETWAYVPAVLSKGADWFLAQGKRGSRGLKWVSVCGDVRRPGVFEVPMGTTYRELISRAGGVVGGWKNLKAFAPSGPTYGFRPAEDVKGTTIDFRDKEGQITVGSGAVVVLNKSRCLVEAALNFTRFFRNESCGKCVPCRVGSRKMVDVIKVLRAGRPVHSPEAVVDAVDRLDDLLQKGSICGLGQVVSAPIKSVLKHFEAEVEDHFLRARCPAGVCFDPRTYIA